MIAIEQAPDAVEYGQFTDADDAFHWMAILYWNGGQDRFSAWSSTPTHAAFWEDAERTRGTSGYFREVFTAPDIRMETLYSAPDIDAGVGAACPVHAGPIRHHNYWGGMRDRLAVSAVDPLDAPAGSTADTLETVESRGRRISLGGYPGLAVIHSGQHLERMGEHELDLYNRRILPALKGGMRYLRDHPAEAGCYSCRYVQETDAEGQAVDRTFGWAQFVSLRHLEDWAEHHPTHRRIFNSFWEMADQLGGEIDIRLWHEVTVPDDSAQLFEYINCHPGTGMLPYADRQIRQGSTHESATAD